MLTLPLYAVTIFLGAMLVFGVQPIAARLLLPWFGGSPSVWSAVSLFFQLALLVGYAYSFLLTRALRPRRQPLVHLGVLAAPLLFIPITLTVTGADASGEAPALDVIRVLAVGLAVPFIVASTTGPLLQRWFSFTRHRSAADPYFLYAASNAGSLLVLLAYPFLIEPNLTLTQQSGLWSTAYLAFAVLSGACAVVVMLRGPRTEVEKYGAASDASAEPIAWSRRIRWVVLGAVPAALSLATTQHISTDVAAVPLLWIAPLGLYLASFVVAFSRRNPMHSGQSASLLPIVVALAAALPFMNPPMLVTISVNLALLFVAAVMCHSLVAEDRPHTSRLTEYYLLLSIGGAVGGAFVSLVAPTLFEAVWEYPVAIIAAVLLCPRGAWGRSIIASVGIVLAAAVLLGAYVIAPGVLPSMLVWTAAVAILVAIAQWRLPFVIAMAVLLGGVTYGGGGVYAERTFFGVYRVTVAEDQYRLVHGTTIHGLQHTSPELRAVASTYFHRTGPVGQVFTILGPELQRVAVVGLGVGTLVTYGTAKQEFTFYEIDPAVVDIATDPTYFTYLRDADATVEIVVADGRLGLAADSAKYDLIVLDAFSSDSVPVHLLTREAIEIYRERLRDGGVMAFNITNRHLELEPVLGALARDMELYALVQHDTRISGSELREGKAASKWVIMAASPQRLAPFAKDPRWGITTVDSSARPWTDDFADIFRALK